MEHHYTSKLFYKKYPYKILITHTYLESTPDKMLDWTVSNANKFLKSLGIKYRMYNQVVYKKKKQTLVTVTSSLFLESKQDFDVCYNKWKDLIQLVVAPYKEEHIDFLKDNTEIIIRDTLLYRRYKYVVLFRRAYKEDISDLDNWVDQSFITTPAKKSNAKWLSNSWWPRLYLSEDSDLVLTKLTHGDRIRSITMICTFDDLETTFN